jgi:predicted nucleic acid-binding protein
VYILDTDVLSLMFRFPGQQPHLERKVKATPYEHIYITVISIDEAVQGAYILRDNRRNPLGCYELLAKIPKYYGQFQALTCDERAMRVFDGFSAEIKRAAGSINDRKIAAIALVHNYTVITRNEDHFRPTGVRCENWTLA